MLLCIKVNLDPVIIVYSCIFRLICHLTFSLVSCRTSSTSIVFISGMYAYSFILFSFILNPPFYCKNNKQCLPSYRMKEFCHIIPSATVCLLTHDALKM